MTVLSLIVPMYNEAEGIDVLFARTLPILHAITPDFEIIAVDDGSLDGTLARLADWNAQEPRIKAIGLSRNFGKEAALSAGLEYAGGAAVIPFDADLQDPPELIPELVAKWQEGYKVVLATRRSRPGDSWLKARSAGWFYRLFNRVSTIPIPANTGDFRLMDRNVVEAVRKLPERIRFMKGLFAWVGFPTTTVYYDRPERHAGVTSWNPWKLWQFALDGILAFTTLPLRVWTYLGAFISLCAFGYGIFLIARTVLHGTDVPGYVSLMTAILFFSGVQLLSLGILGEYVGRIYREVKRRPVFLVAETIGL